MPDQKNQFTSVARIYDELMHGIAYRYWVRYIRQLWKQRGSDPRTVLDVACGTGNVSFILAEEGYEVTGVDISPEMIEVANSKLLARRKRGLTPDPVFFCQDASQLDLGRTFDTAISLFDSLNYITDPACLAEAFRRILHLLEPGGVFLFDMNTEYALQEGFFDQDNLSENRYPKYQWKSIYDSESKLCRIDMRFEALDGSTGQVHEFWETHFQRSYSLPELTSMLQEAGFRDIQFYHAYSSKKPRARTDRIYTVCQR